jgi:ferredoxin-like protein FixX
MPGMFIDVQVDATVAKDAALAKKLVEVCPVNIFAQNADGSVAIVEKNLDECTLCELCLAVGRPGQVAVRKLYDDSARLERRA